MKMKMTIILIKTFYITRFSYDGNDLTNGKDSYIIRLLDFESQAIIASSTNIGTWETVTNDKGPLKHGDIGGILKLGNSAGFRQLRGKIAAMAITSKYIDCNYEFYHSKDSRQKTIVLEVCKDMCLD